MLAFHAGVPAQAMAAPLLIQLHADKPGRVAEDVSSAWVPATHMGNPNESLRCCCGHLDNASKCKNSLCEISSVSVTLYFK